MDGIATYVVAFFVVLSCAPLRSVLLVRCCLQVWNDLALFAGVLCSFFASPAAFPLLLAEAKPSNDVEQSTATPDKQNQQERKTNEHLRHLGRVNIAYHDISHFISVLLETPAARADDC